jgi:NADPH:quinone reductase-like Zn-dependent oxidoreductase
MPTYHGWYDMIRRSQRSRSIYESICFRVPKNVSLREAATVPLASLTAWLAFFSKDSLNIDRTQSDTVVLIWGGSCK